MKKKPVRTRINGLRVTFTFHPKMRVYQRGEHVTTGGWSGVVHAKTGTGTIPGGSGATLQEAKKSTMWLLRSVSKRPSWHRPRRSAGRSPDRSPSRSHSKKGTKAWEIWADGHFAESFGDKGEAQRKIARLKRSHPYTEYRLRRRRSGARMQFGTRSRRRYTARMLRG